MRHGPLHLGYCTNVHGADSAAEVVAMLGRVPRRVRERLEAPSLGLGLYLSRAAADAFTLDRAPLVAALAAGGLYVYTLNGFPYGDFHAARVKEAVYAPDWTDRRRLDHTLRLASLLDALAPADVTAPTISTVPLGWRRAWPAGASDAAAVLLVETARALGTLAQRSGRAVRLCLEPEPGCVLERTRDVVQFFEGPLARAAGPDEELVRAHLGVCYDTCHQAVMFEEPRTVLATLDGAHIPVGKVQLSSALAVSTPSHLATRTRLRSFDEPRYLHQVRALKKTGVDGTDDLPEALAGDALADDVPWRVHFHVPIHLAHLGDGLHELGTTQEDLRRAIAALQHRPDRAWPQLEVETYTWSVLPAAERADGDDALTRGITDELRWAREALT